MTPEIGILYRKIKNDPYSWMPVGTLIQIIDVYEVYENRTDIRLKIIKDIKHNIGSSVCKLNMDANSDIGTIVCSLDYFLEEFELA